MQIATGQMSLATRTHSLRGRRRKVNLQNLSATGLPVRYTVTLHAG